MKISCQNILISLSTIIWLLGVPTAASAQTNVSGTISGPVTWTLLPGPGNNGSPYIVQGDIIISGGALTIEPDVEVRFNGNYYLQGQILADGQSSSTPITFTSNQLTPTKGDWNYIQVNPGSVIKHAVIEFAASGIKTSSCAGCSVTDSIVQNNTTGLDLNHQAQATFQNNDIIQNDVGISVTGPQVTSPNVISHNTILNNSIYNATATVFAGVDLTNNWWGTTDPNAIIPTLQPYTGLTSPVHFQFTPFLDGPGGNPTGHEYKFGRISGAVTWSTTYSPYIVIGNIGVGPGSTLTIDPDVTVRFDGNYSITETFPGAIVAQGTPTNPIVFTSNSATPAKGDWGTIRGGSGSIYQYVEAEYGTCGITYHTGATVENNNLHDNISGICAARSITDDIQFNTMSDNDYGFRYDKPQGGAVPTMTGRVMNNSITNNTLFDFKTEGNIFPHFVSVNAENNWWGTVDPLQIANNIEDYQELGLWPSVDFVPFLDAPSGNPIGQSYMQGFITANTTWGPSLNPVLIIGNVVVPSGITLTINPGTLVQAGNEFNLYVQGTLNAQGQPGQEITFTSANGLTPQVGDWQGITIVSASGTNMLTHCNIQYADEGVKISGGAATTVQNCLIKNNNRGVMMQGATTPQVTDNLITKNNDNLYLAADPGAQSPNPTLNNNQITNSRDYHLFAAPGNGFSSATIIAENNWWGTTQVSEIDAKIFDINDDPQSATVDYSPFLNNPGSQNIAITNTSVSNLFIDTAANQMTDIAYTLGQSADVTVVIKNFNTNQVVRTLLNAAPQLSGAHIVSWDGKDDSQNFLPEGTYCYAVYATDSQNNYGEYDPIYVQGAVNILNTSGVANYNPYKGETIPIGYDLSAPGFATIKIGYTTNLFEFLTIADKAPRPTTGNVEVWDGRDQAGSVVVPVPAVPVGIYGWADVLPDNAIIIDTQGVEVTSVKANPYAIFPLYGEVTNIDYTLSQPGEVTIRIYDPNGALVRTLISQQSKSAGQHTEVWDGRDSLGDLISQEGNYSLEVEVSDAAGIHTSILKGNLVVFK